jgi:hypothetical protein
MTAAAPEGLAPVARATTLANVSLSKRQLRCEAVHRTHRPSAGWAEWRRLSPFVLELALHADLDVSAKRV